MTRHELKGCAPNPFSSYLKAVGIFRILAEQKDCQDHGMLGERKACFRHRDEQGGDSGVHTEQVQADPDSRPGGATASTKKRPRSTRA